MLPSEHAVPPDSHAIHTDYAELFILAVVPPLQIPQVHRSVFLLMVVPSTLNKVTCHAMCILTTTPPPKVVTCRNNFC